MNPIIPIATNKALDTLNIPAKKRNIANIKNQNIFDFEKKTKQTQNSF